MSVGLRGNCMSRNLIYIALCTFCDKAYIGPLVKVTQQNELVTEMAIPRFFETMLTHVLA